MENIITLVVIIIVFNLINSLLRSLRGGQTTPRRTVPARSEPSFEEDRADQWVDHAAYSYLKVPQDDDIKPDYDQKTDKNDLEIEDVPEIEEGQPDQLQQKKLCRSSSIVPGFYQALTQKDPLVSAFIFREIFELPPAMRRRR